MITGMEIGGSCTYSKYSLVQMDLKKKTDIDGQYTLIKLGWLQRAFSNLRDWL